MPKYPILKHSIGSERFLDVDTAETRDTPLYSWRIKGKTKKKGSFGKSLTTAVARITLADAQCGITRLLRDTRWKSYTCATCRQSRAAGRWDRLVGSSGCHDKKAV